MSLPQACALMALRLDEGLHSDGWLAGAVCFDGRTPYSGGKNKKSPTDFLSVRDDHYLS